MEWLGDFVGILKKEKNANPSFMDSIDNRIFRKKKITLNNKTGTPLNSFSFGCSFDKPGDNESLLAAVYLDKNFHKPPGVRSAGKWSNWAPAATAAAAAEAAAPCTVKRVRGPPGGAQLCSSFP